MATANTYIELAQEQSAKADAVNSQIKVYQSREYYEDRTKVIRELEEQRLYYATMAVYYSNMALFFKGTTSEESV